MKKKTNLLLSFFLVIILCITLTFFTTIIMARKERETALFGRVIYVDAGHGGKDNGASFNGIVEDEINMKIAGYVMESLIDLGAQVFMSRTGDYDLSSIYDKNKKRNDLIKRVNLINNSSPDLFISIHLNSFPSDNVRGAQVFYQNNDNSKLLAGYIQEELNELSISKDRRIKSGDYYILNKTKVVGVIVECGFLSNTEERNFLLEENYQRKISKRITNGMVDYFTNLVD